MLSKAAKGEPATPTGAQAKLLMLSLDSLDENPHQPRKNIEAGPLNELMEAIRRSHGLLQPIVVSAVAGGRYIIVAGHRRVEAYRRLRDTAPENEKADWSRIPAVPKAADSEGALASMAYSENAHRVDLNAVEDAAAISQLFERKIVATLEEAAALINKPLAHVRRMRALGEAAELIRSAVHPGLRVATGADADGKEVTETRKLSLVGALAFVRFEKHLRSTLDARKAAARLEATLRRALRDGWSDVRVETFVAEVQSGKVKSDAAVAETEAVANPVLKQTKQRLTVDITRLGELSAAEKATLRELFKSFL
jgi:ParB family chromosome partitioning protein